MEKRYKKKSILRLTPKYTLLFRNIYCSFQNSQAFVNAFFSQKNRVLSFFSGISKKSEGAPFQNLVKFLLSEFVFPKNWQKKEKLRVFATKKRKKL